MATSAAMKKPKVEEEAEAEAANRLSAHQIPNDKEGLIDFMDQRAKSIEALKHQLSNLDRKVSSSSSLLSSFICFFCMCDEFFHSS